MISSLLRTCTALLCLGFSFSALAQNGDRNAVPPGTILVSAYKTITEAEKLEAAKKYKASWDKYHQALRYYKSLSTAHPTWNPHIINGRLKSTSESIKRITPLAQKEYMAAKSKVKDFIEGGGPASPAGIPAPAEKVFNPREKQQLADINQNLGRYQKAFETERLRNQAREKKLSQQISKLQDDLRRQNQGVGKESPQVKILNGEIARLRQDVRRAKQLDTKTREKYEDSIERLQRMRAALASAPLRQDVEKLRAENQARELELGLLARKQKQKIAELKQLQASKAKTEDDYALLKNQFELNQKQLADSQHNTKIVVKSLRKANAELQAKLQESLELNNKQKAQITDLTARLAKSNSITADLRTELANMTRERDQLSELLKLSDVDRGKQLMRENLRLAKELQDNKKALAMLNADKNVALDRIIQAENNVAIAKKQIIDLRTENLSFKKRVTHLEDTLKDTMQNLSKKLAVPQLDTVAREEAELLKKTVKRLVASQNRRQKVITALGSEYKKMAFKSKGFEASYNALAKQNLTLTDRERQLIANRESDATLFNENRTYADSETRNIAEQRVEAKVAAYNSVALRFIEKDQFEVAKDIYDEAYDTTYDFSFLVSRGIVRLRLGDLKHLEEASEILEEAVTTRPRNPYSHFMLGIARFQLKKDDLALKSLNEAISLKPDYPRAYTYRGIIYAEKGQFSKAQKNFEEAIALNPELPEAQFNLSELFYIQGKKSNAKSAYANALRAGYPINLAHEKKLGITKAQ